MFIMNGIVYAGETEKAVTISKIKILPDYIMLITFSTGETRLFDGTILQGKVFEPLRNAEIFQSAQIDHGVVTWLNGEIDCAPEYMYENSYEYPAINVC